MDLVPKKVDDNAEWVIIIGSAGAVGSFAVQVCFIDSKNASRANESYRLPTCVATRF